MTRNTMNHVFALLFLTFGLIACSSSDSTIKGHTVEVLVVHHTEEISGCTVWLKELSDNFPGWDTQEYDFMEVSDDAGVLEFEGILPGNHYLLGLGYDGRDSVKGYMAIEIDAQDPDQYQKVLLYVSE